MAIEKADDLQQYRDSVEKNSLQHRKANGVCWYPLKIVETGYGLGDYPFVVVERPTDTDQPHRFGGGVAVSLFSNQPGVEESTAEGRVHFATSTKMKIIFTQNEHPDWLSDGKIGVNLLFDQKPYREMEKAIDLVIKAERDRTAELRDIFDGEKEPAFLTRKELCKSERGIPMLPIPEEIRKKLNDSQVNAIEMALSAMDFAIIHGPPGTGKTTTLVALLSQLTRFEKPVLVCAPSNAAVDLLTERSAEKGMNVLRLGNLSRIDDNVLRHTLEARTENHPDYKEIRRIKKQADEFRRMANKYKRQFGKAEREQRNLLFKEARSLIDDANRMEKQLVDQLLREADIVATTLVGSATDYLENRRFGTVVIDEAGQALEPATWVPILRADRVILAGDPCQLPPTVKSQEAARKGLSHTLIERLIARQPAVSMLGVQYRMHEAIMGFSNEKFYGNELTAFPTVAKRQLIFQTADLPENEIINAVEFIDTAGCGFEEKMNPETRSPSNPDEFTILKKHLKALLSRLERPELYSIGIISPYKEQVRYMEDQIQKDEILGKHPGISINTVDAFQGQERNIIYLSLVRSNDRNEIGFLSDYRRINVAMTRAMEKLVLVGDSATLGGTPFYADLLTYVEHLGGYRSAWEFMD